MKNGFIKVGTAVPAIRVGAVSDNRKECEALLHLAEEQNIKILVFPELTLTGATAGDLFMQKNLLSAAEKELEEYIKMTSKLDILSFIGLPALVNGKIYNTVAAVSHGELLALVPKCAPIGVQSRWFDSAPEYNFNICFAGRETLFGSDIIFTTDTLPELSLAVTVGSDRELLYSPSRVHAAVGANIIVNPSAEVETVTRGDRLRGFIKSESDILSLSYVISEAGEGESGTDGIYAGRSLIAECGNILAERHAFSEDKILSAVCDVEKTALEAAKLERIIRRDIPSYDYVEFKLTPEITETPKLDKSPFIPECDAEFERRAEEILAIQSRALAGRITRSYSKGAVIGLSGGLDSTLALLVTVKAFDLLALDRKNILSVTMPCFGTTNRTKGNAERLAEALGTSLECIDIKESVTLHFKDIGHSFDNYNVVYENAQARERTQVLMDLANAKGALVIGTGDLSELALGFATYNGDHMSMYGVNSDIPKTLMRRLVSHIASSTPQKTAEILFDILNTPVSPELLPPKNGEIAQCTEGIVGPYELHDFFLYYLVRYGFAPDKILRLADKAFEGEYEHEVILGWLKMFVRRFFSQQFKRSCLPDGPRVGSVALSPRGGFIMPSDAVSEEWLKNLK